MASFVVKVVVRVLYIQLIYSDLLFSRDYTQLCRSCKVHTICVAPWLFDYLVGLLTPVCIHFCETDDCLKSGSPLHITGLGLGSSFHSTLGFSLIKNTLPCFSWISKINWCNSSVRKKCARFHVWFPRSFMSGGRRKRGHEGGLDRDSRLPQGQGLWVMCFPSPETRMSILFTKSCLRRVCQVLP